MDNRFNRPKINTSPWIAKRQQDGSKKLEPFTYDETETEKKDGTTPPSVPKTRNVLPFTRKKK